LTGEHHASAPLRYRLHQVTRPRQRCRYRCQACPRCPSRRGMSRVLKIPRCACYHRVIHIAAIDIIWPYSGIQLSAFGRRPCPPGPSPFYRAMPAGPFPSIALRRRSPPRQQGFPAGPLPLLQLASSEVCSPARSAGDERAQQPVPRYAPFHACVLGRQYQVGRESCRTRSPPPRAEPCADIRRGLRAPQSDVKVHRPPCQGAVHRCLPGTILTAFLSDYRRLPPKRQCAP
jgi:hypothetical protein